MPRRAGEMVLSAVVYWCLTGIIAAVGFSFGFYLLKPAAADRPPRDWLDALTWEDGKWYKQIVNEGYRYDRETQSNVAFFPVFPLFGRALVQATGARAELALFVVSNASLLLALVILACYVRDRWPDAPPDFVDLTLLASALFPTACFFRLSYSESTFVLFEALSMYAMLRQWHPAAIAIIVGLTTAVRPVGVALLVPFAIHLARRPSVLQHGTSLPKMRETSLGLLIYLPLSCWGVLVFQAYQWGAFGDALAMAHAQDHWRLREAAGWGPKLAALAALEPISAVYDSHSPVFWAKLDSHGIPWLSLQFANPIFFIFAVGLVMLGSRCKWLSEEETSLAIMMLLIPYMSRSYEMGMGSMGRFTAVIIPLHLVIGHVLVRLQSPVRAALLAICGFYFGLLNALYAARYEVF